MVRRVTAKMMFDRFASTYPLLAKEMRYYHQCNGLQICVYLKDSAYCVYDYITNKIDQLIYPDEKEPYIEEDSFYESKQDYANYFSKNLRGWMHVRNMTSRELAKLSGISEVSISRYLNGKRIPDGYTIGKIANILKCKADDLYV